MTTISSQHSALRRKHRPIFYRVAHEAWALATTLYATESRPELLKQQVRWAFSAALHAGAIERWIDALKTPELALFAELNPGLMLKPLRVYVSVKWDITRKIKIMTDTYSFIRANSALLDALTLPAGITLAQFDIADYPGVRVVLDYDNRYRKEGELVVSLWHEALGGPVIALAFTLEQLQNGEWAMYVGCIQGLAGVDNKSVSKAMHGLWPKIFIVSAAQEIARALGMSHLFGISEAIHSHRKKRMVYIPSRHALAFDYNGLWEEVGGVAAREGWYELPLAMERRPYEEMKSNKRAMYKRRYAMLDDISQQVSAVLKRMP